MAKQHHLRAGQGQSRDLSRVVPLIGKEGDVRAIKAHQTVVDYGAGYLNPLVGDSAGETCANVESIVGFVHGMVDSDNDIEAARPALALILQTVWAAVQYEREVSHG